MTTLFDTQIVSYWVKGVEPASHVNGHISSITASELLLMQGPLANRANYYVPMFWSRGDSLLRREQEGGHVPRNALLFGYTSRPRRLVQGIPNWQQTLSRIRTDHLILDFGTDYPPIVEYGSWAITELINHGAKQLFAQCIVGVEKRKKRLVEARFGHIVDFKLKSLPLTTPIAERGLELFGEFSARFTIKQNIRNTINDILILATAIEHAVPLETRDTVLNRFAADYYGTPLERHDGLLKMHFEHSRAQKMHRKGESKRYINRSWKVFLRNQTRPR